MLQRVGELLAVLLQLCRRFGEWAVRRVSEPAKGGTAVGTEAGRKEGCERMGERGMVRLQSVT